MAAMLTVPRRMISGLHDFERGLGAQLESARNRFRAGFKQHEFMGRILLAIAVVLSLVPALCAQDDLFGKISCHRAMVEDPQNQPYAKKLWDGYEMSLGPARNGGVDGDGCTAAIYNSG